MNRVPVISFVNVTKSFGTEVVLKNVSVDLYSDELTFIMGPSGIGKSVFLKLALSFEQPDSGEIIVHGEPLRSLTAQKLREFRSKHILIFQQPALFDFLSVVENVCFPYLEHYPQVDESPTFQKAENILRKMGYKGDVHKRPETVTQSEAKIGVMARALMMDPMHLFFDEPTTGLDEVTRNQVDAELKEVTTSWKKGCTVISHDVRSAMNIADRIIFLHSKGIYADSRDPKSFLQNADPIIRDFFQPGMLF